MSIGWSVVAGCRRRSLVGPRSVAGKRVEYGGQLSLNSSRRGWEGVGWIAVPAQRRVRSAS